MSAMSDYVMLSSGVVCLFVSKTERLVKNKVLF